MKDLLNTLQNILDDKVDPAVLLDENQSPAPFIRELKKFEKATTFAWNESFKSSFQQQFPAGYLSDVSKKVDEIKSNIRAIENEIGERKQSAGSVVQRHLAEKKEVLEKIFNKENSDKAELNKKLAEIDEDISKSTRELQEASDEYERIAAENEQLTRLNEQLKIREIPLLEAFEQEKTNTNNKLDLGIFCLSVQGILEGFSHIEKQLHELSKQHIAQYNKKIDDFKKSSTGLVNRVKILFAGDKFEKELEQYKKQQEEKIDKILSDRETAVRFLKKGIKELLNCIKEKSLVKEESRVVFHDSANRDIPQDLWFHNKQKKNQDSAVTIFHFYKKKDQEEQKPIDRQGSKKATHRRSKFGGSQGG